MSQDFRLPPGAADEVEPPPLPAPGEAFEPQYLAYSSAAMHPYESASPRARVLIRLLWGLAALQVVMLWPTVDDLFDLREARARGDTSVVLEEEISTPADVAFQIVGIVQAAVWVLVVVYWMMWVHRTYRNLRPLGAEGLSTTPGWAVVYNFIPIVNLYKPFLIMLETWRASDPAHPGGTHWRGLPPARIVLVWWGMYLLSMLITVGAIVAIGVAGMSAGWTSAPTPAQLDMFYAAAWAALVVVGLDIVIYVMEIEIVKTLTQLQEARANALTAVPFAAPAGVDEAGPGG